jgi:hypothetical protein
MSSRPAKMALTEPFPGELGKPSMVERSMEAAGIEPAQHFARPQVRGRAPSMSLYEMMPA